MPARIPAQRPSRTESSPASAPPSAPAAGPRPSIPPFTHTVLATLLCLSGIAALVYQTVWIKQLSLVVGADVHAVSLCVSAFLAGLAAGGYAFGRRADTTTDPLALFARLELGIALLSLAATLALPRSAALFATLERTAGPLAWALPFVLVGLPATLMGGSLPVMVRALAPTRHDPLGALGGKLYAANTAGAVAGCLLAAFLLIPELGLTGSALAALALNLTAATLAWRVRPIHSIHTDSHSVSTIVRPPSGARLALVLYAIAGGAALGYEVVWTQVLVLWTGTRVFAFAIVLAVYLLGLVLGSTVSARRVDRAAEPWAWFALLVAAAGTASLVLVVALGGWLPALQVRAATAAFRLAQSEPLAMAARFAVASVCVVGLPTVLLGAAFPFALRLAGGAGQAGRDSGATLAASTLGGIVGSLATGFVLVPALGPERALAVLALIAGGVGLAASWRAGSPARPLGLAVMACVGASFAASALIAPDHLARLLAAERGGTLLFARSGAGGAVAVIEQTSGSHAFRRLYIQGVSNSGDSMTSLRYMRLQALTPLVIHRGEPRAALVIGLGTGITAGSLLPYDGLEQRVCAELLPEVAQAAALFRGNQNAPNDPRLALRLRDGRRELLHNHATYDVITLEPPPPSAAGVVNLYSRDFYSLAASRLNPDGLLAQWLPLPTQNEQDTRSLIRAFLDVFPHATLWSTELHEMMLVGSLTPIELDAPRIRKRLDQPGVSRLLREVGIDNPAALLATYVCDRPSLERYAGSAPTITDDQPRIEYGPWPLPGAFERSLANLLELHTNPPLLRGDPTLEAELRTQRDTLYQFYASALYAYQGDKTRWQQSLASALRSDPTNPYFRWFAPGSTADPGSSRPRADSR